MALSDAGLVLGLDHVTLVVEDLGEAVATYETLFAQSCAGRGKGDGLNWALFAVANTALVLVAPHGEPTHPVRTHRQPTGWDNDRHWCARLRSHGT